MKCTNISLCVKNFFSPPQIFQAQCGRPAKICYEEIIRKSTGYVGLGGLALLACFVIPCSKPQKACSDALAVFPILTSTMSIFALLVVEAQIRKACSRIYESNAREFLYSSKPSQKLVDEVLKSSRSREKLLELAKFNGSLQKDKMIPLIALYVDRNAVNEDQFIRLFNAAPWTKEDKFICLKTLVERNNIDIISRAFEKGLFKADDLSLSQKQELWQRGSSSIRPLLERLGCSFGGNC